jgi:proteasome lid subunit RPN8/RPN11
MSVPEHHPLVREFASLLVSAFDKRPLTFRASDKTGARRVRQICQRSTDQLCPLKPAVNRNAFLLGCQQFTDDLPIEHLIVGFGFVSGSTAKIVSLFHSVGTEGQVAISPVLQTAIEQFYHSDLRAEVLIFHNHPGNWAWASDADRRTLFAHYLKPAAIFKFFGQGGRIRFFLGADNSVREFVAPQPLDFLSS